MGHVHYQKDIDWDQCLIDDLTVPVKDRLVFMPQKIFDSIGDYTRSCPTSPSAGRIYKKALNWPALYGDYRHDEDPNWWIFLCENDPDEEGYVLHHPFKVVISDGPLGR